MSQARHTEPLPLGSADEPYSKGLMARALIAVGVPAVRAHELARRVDGDLLERGAQSVELERFEELAVAVLGETEGGDAIRRLRQYQELQDLGYQETDMRRYLPFSAISKRNLQFSMSPVGVNLQGPEAPSKFTSLPLASTFRLASRCSRARASVTCG